MLSTNFWDGFVKQAEKEASKPHEVTTTVKEKNPPKEKAEGEPERAEPEQAAAAQADALEQEEAAAAQPPLDPTVDEALQTGTGWSASDTMVNWDARWERFYDRRPDLLAKQDPDVIAKYPHIVAKYPEVFEQTETMVDHDPAEEMAYDPSRVEEPKVASHAAELAGLGILAAPSAAALAGKKVNESTAHKAELVGLGTLAAPSAWAVTKKFFRKGK